MLLPGWILKLWLEPFSTQLAAWSLEAGSCNVRVWLFACHLPPLNFFGFCPFDDFLRFVCFFLGFFNQPTVQNKKIAGEGSLAVAVGDSDR